MDANGLAQGGLAQMTLPNLNPAGSLGVPGSGFASRGKGAHIKRLSTTAIPGPNVMNADQPSLPRTSRSHLLAGLRTAPKTPTVAAPPPSAPPTQLHHDPSLDQARIVPQTAVGSAFPLSLNPMNAGRQMYSLPEQVLAPPAISLMPGQEHMDPGLYAELFATNMYLAQQQQRLQQQLINVTAAAQQFQHLGVGSPGGYGVEQVPLASPLSPGFGFPNANHLRFMPQPQPQPQPPMHAPEGVGMPSTPRRASPPRVERERMSPSGATSRFATQVSPPSFPDGQRNGPFAKPLASPTHQAPLALPPPSANAFRAGHKKATSMVSVMNGASTSRDLASPAMPKTAGIPPTPMTGTFGPGQGRAGEHPVRQPRGPPPLEELTVSPTSRQESSKNFVTRQRRRAVHSLVRAGMERRGGRGNGSTGSAGSSTPASETDLTFSLPSDTESDHRRGSDSRSRKPSLGSIRAAASGAIGSERKSKGSPSRERDLADGLYTAASISSDEGAAIGGPLVEVKADAPPEATLEDRRKMPMLVLTSAAKRKSSMF